MAQAGHGVRGTRREAVEMTKSQARTKRSSEHIWLLAAHKSINQNRREPETGPEGHRHDEGSRSVCSRVCYTPPRACTLAPR